MVREVILVPRCTIVFMDLAGSAFSVRRSEGFGVCGLMVANRDWSKVSSGERLAGNPMVSPGCVVSALIVCCGRDTTRFLLDLHEEKSNKKRTDI